MSLKATLNEDLKQAMLTGDKDRTTLLRGLKSAILYAEVAQGIRDTGLPDDEILTVLAKEAKKRQESADLYRQAGDTDREQTELTEKRLIETYLPAQLSEEETTVLIEEVVQQTGANSTQQMGQVIGQVKQKAGPGADGAMIARLVKERLNK